MLPFVLHGCETWSVTLNEERSLWVFENGVLREVLDLRVWTCFMVCGGMGRACGTYGGEERYIRVLMGNMRGEDLL
jgi:hypothetical protein